MINNQKIITIDGPAGSGKSTIAQKLAEKLNWTHINTGAIYRTFGLLVSRIFQNKSLPDPNELSDKYIQKITTEMNIGYFQDKDTHQIFLKNENITNTINSPDVSNLASLYAQNANIRKCLLPLQRKLVDKYHGVIVDGRDMGTIVFPEAPLKIFLTANPTTRAKRRFTELQSSGLNVNFDTLLKELEDRDHRDSTRKIAPTKPAQDAIIIDSSDDTIDEVVNKILALYHAQEK